MTDYSPKEPGDQIRLYSEARLPTDKGDFDVQVFRRGSDATEAVVISKGLKGAGLICKDNIFLRVHSECFTGEVLGSLKCDCKGQLEIALNQINMEGQGLVIYLRQEGRGIGLGNKIKAYHLQNEQGMDTIEANHALGFDEDLRDFSYAAKILSYLGITKVRLNTNNPDKINCLREYGLCVSQVVPSLAQVNPHNSEYLKTKYQKMGHTLSPLFQTPVSD